MRFFVHKPNVINDNIIYIQQLYLSPEHGELPIGEPWVLDATDAQELVDKLQKFLGKEVRQP